MKLLPFVLSIIAITSLSGCGDKETYTVDYLKENEAKRTEVLAECAENKQSDVNCKNANEAEGRAKLEEIRKKQNR